MEDYKKERLDNWHLLLRELSDLAPANQTLIDKYFAQMHKKNFHLARYVYQFTFIKMILVIDKDKISQGKSDDDTFKNIGCI